MKQEIDLQKQSLNKKEKWDEPKLEVLSIDETEGYKTSDLNTEGAGNTYVQS
ncbi:MAG: hypothetical protein K9I29_08200 [Bacteroidales bacterium]|nr:hypothetical protein [Bacteroidales bacterium]MCF8328264.1 hypothetical protein [Bacteroidales bacterium]